MSTKGSILKQLAILTATVALTLTGSALANVQKQPHVGTAARMEVLSVTFDWTIATNRAERIFPGTKQWLLNCSSHEGGHGRFVWNTQGSGAGGWMQFMEGTFNSYVWASYREMLNRGYKLQFPARFMSWKQPLGQALTAAYMRTIGVSHIHWDPSIDRNCL